jgi:hypothetical protein
VNIDAFAKYPVPLLGRAQVHPFDTRESVFHVGDFVVQPLVRGLNSETAHQFASSSRFRSCR